MSASRGIGAGRMRSSLLLSLLGAAVAGCATAPAAPSFRAGPGRIAVVSAFEPELARLRVAAEIRESRIVNGRTVWVATRRGW